MTPLAEIAMSFIWPLKWPHVYIPSLPLQLISVLQAPTPVLVGIHSDWLKLLSYPLEDCVLVDMDRYINPIYVST
jgi:myotubularin-related protein 5/13